jgi:hypothetical protein
MGAYLCSGSLIASCADAEADDDDDGDGADGPYMLTAYHCTEEYDDDDAVSARARCLRRR